MNTEFKKILLDEGTIKTTDALNYERTKLERTAGLITLVLAVLPTADRNEIHKLTWSELDSKIKENFPYPAADEKLNLDLLGVYDAYNNLKEYHRINSFAFDVEPLTAEKIEAITESNRIYSATPEQNEAFQLAQTLFDNLNRAKELGLIPTVQDLFHFRSVFRMSQYTGKMEIDTLKLQNIVINLK